MSNIAIINDNNNFAPSIFRSLCEFVGDCFGPRYFSSGATLPQKNTSVQNNHLRFHTMTSKKMVRSYYCLNKSHHSFNCVQSLTSVWCIILMPHALSCDWHDWSPLHPSSQGYCWVVQSCMITKTLWMNLASPYLQTFWHERKMR